jgi:hypothetical protein
MIESDRDESRTATSSGSSTVNQIIIKLSTRHCVLMSDTPDAQTLAGNGLFERRHKTGDCRVLRFLQAAGSQ